MASSTEIASLDEPPSCFSRREDANHDDCGARDVPLLGSRLMGINEYGALGRRELLIGLFRAATVDAGDRRVLRDRRLL